MAEGFRRRTLASSLGPPQNPTTWTTRELRKKRFEPEGSEKYKEVNNNIKRCMKKAQENWIGEQRLKKI